MDSALLIIRLVLVALSGVVVGFGRTTAGFDLGRWFGTLALSQRIELLGALILCVLLIGFGWLLFEIMAQQGRLLLRIEAVEAGLGTQARDTGRSVAGLAVGTPTPAFRLSDLDAGPVTIPRVFHRIWLGTQQMPDEFVQYGETWQRHHPGWTMRLWTDENLPEISNKQEFLLAAKMSYKSDILRYEVIYKYGGVYIDTDFKCLRNIEPLLKGVQAFAALEEPGVVCGAIFGAEQGHPLLADAIAQLPSSFWSKRHLNNSVQIGPLFFTEIVAKHPQTVVFDPTFFYPYHWSEKWRKGQEFPDAYAVHHWTGSWRNPIKTASIQAR